MNDPEHAALEGRLIMLSNTLDKRLDSLMQVQLEGNAWRTTFLQNHWVHLASSVESLSGQVKLLKWVIGLGVGAVLVVSVSYTHLTLPTKRIV